MSAFFAGCRGLFCHSHIAPGNDDERNPPQIKIIEDANA